MRENAAYRCNFCAPESQQPRATATTAWLAAQNWRIRGLNHHHARVYRRAGCPWHRRRRRAGGAPMGIEPGARVSGGRRRSRTARARFNQRCVSGAVLVHHQRRSERRGHRRTGNRVSSVSDRSRTVISPIVDDAPPGDWPWRLAGSAHQRLDCGCRDGGWEESARGYRAGSEPLAVLDGNRA